jgi:hypothetical protein
MGARHAAPQSAAQSNLLIVTYLPSSLVGELSVSPAG